MKFVSTRTKGEWYSIDEAIGDEEDDEQAVEDSPGAEEILNRSLVEMLQAERLCVLCGLGTSLCLKGNDGERLAPTMLDLWEAVEEEIGDGFEVLLKEVHFPEIKTNADKDIELLLSKCQLLLALKYQKRVADFVKKAEAVIVGKVSFLDDIDSLPNHETFLRRIARRSTRATRTQLFTTNYDQCFEAAAGNLRFVVVDGFSHTMPQTFGSEHFSYDFVRREDGRESPDFIPNVFHLIKLHGSIDWEQSNGELQKIPSPDRPVLIYPRNSKFESSYERPFLELMGRFMASLRQPNMALLIIGFGFNDKHIVEPIMSAIRSNVSLRVCVVDPNAENSSNEVFEHLRTLVEDGDPRIMLVADYFETFVSRVPDLVAATEEEVHLDRVRRLIQ